MIRVAIVTVSDSCFRGTRRDASGPALKERIGLQGWEIVRAAIVPDEADRIAAELRSLSDSADLILTTGGTGIAARDVTPEATRSVIEREVPGIAEFIRAEGARSTKRAILSRGVAGARGRTLIINLPGSPSGAVESFNAVADVITHAVDLLQGQTEHKGQ